MTTQEDRAKLRRDYGPKAPPFAAPRIEEEPSAGVPEARPVTVTANWTAGGHNFMSEGNINLQNVDLSVDKTGEASGLSRGGRRQ